MAEQQSGGLPPPERLGPYALLEPLPPRGMLARWWARRDDDASAPCILEHLHPQLADDPTARGRFERLGLISPHLQHPNLVRTLEVGAVDGVGYLTREWVVGATLARWVEAGPELGTALTAAVLVRVLAGLEHAHAATSGRGRPLDIVHRSLGADCVELSFGGHVVLGGFEAAAARVGQHRTAVGTGVGEARCFAPEQALGQPVGPAADIYAVAGLGVQMLTGRPVVPEGLDLVDTLRAVVQGPVPGVSGPLGPILARAAAKAPDQRFPSAASFRRAIESAVPERPGVEAIAKALRAALPDEETALLHRLARARGRDRASTPARPRRSEATQLVPRRQLQMEAEEPSVFTMPGQAVDAPVAPPPPSRRFGTVLVLGLACGLVAAAAVLASRLLEAPPEAEKIEVSSGPRPQASPRTEPRPAARPPRPTRARRAKSEIPAKPEVPAKPEPGPRTEAPTRSEPAPAPVAPEPSRTAPASKWEAELRELELGADPRRFFALAAELRRAVERLPAAARERAERQLEAAERVQDIGALRRVARALSRP